MICSKCKNEVDPLILSRPDTQHAGEMRCPKCNFFLGWKKKDKNEGKRANGRFTAESLGITTCQMCLRPREYLGTSEVLEVHHIIEISKGGPDIVSNIWVICTPCHRLIHHQRLYLHEHLEFLYKLKAEFNEPAEEFQDLPWDH